MYKSYKKRGLADLDIFDIVDDKGKYKAELHIPIDEWREYENRDELVDLIAEYTFPDWCINACTYDIIVQNNREIVIVAMINPDLT